MQPAFITVLQKHLEQALASLPLVRQNETVRPPRIFIGDLPVKQTERDDIPCVLLMPVSGYQQGGEAGISVGLICCVYNNEEGDREGAEMDIALLLSAVTQALMPCVTAPLASRYRLVPDPRTGFLLPWEKSDTQPRPFMQATLLSIWRMKGLEQQPVA